VGVLLSLIALLTWVTLPMEDIQQEEQRKMKVTSKFPSKRKLEEAKKNLLWYSAEICHSFEAHTRQKM
jgi:hypothetical protein